MHCAHLPRRRTRREGESGGARPWRVPERAKLKKIRWRRAYESRGRRRPAEVSSRARCSSYHSSISRSSSSHAAAAATSAELLAPAAPLVARVVAEAEGRAERAMRAWPGRAPPKLCELSVSLSLSPSDVLDPSTHKTCSVDHHSSIVSARPSQGPQEASVAVSAAARGRDVRYACHQAVRDIAPAAVAPRDFSRRVHVLPPSAWPLTARKSGGLSR